MMEAVDNRVRGLVRGVCVALVILYFSGAMLTIFITC